MHLFVHGLKHRDSLSRAHRCPNDFFFPSPVFGSRCPPQRPPSRLSRPGAGRSGVTLALMLRTPSSCPCRGSIRARWTGHTLIFRCVLVVLLTILTRRKGRSQVMEGRRLIGPLGTLLSQHDQLRGEMKYSSRQTAGWGKKKWGPKRKRSKKET